MHSIIQWLRQGSKSIVYSEFLLLPSCSNYTCTIIHAAIIQQLFSTNKEMVKTKDNFFSVSSPLGEGIHVVSFFNSVNFAKMIIDHHLYENFVTYFVSYIKYMCEGVNIHIYAFRYMEVGKINFSFYFLVFFLKIISYMCTPWYQNFVPLQNKSSVVCSLNLVDEHRVVLTMGSYGLIKL